MDGMEFAPDLMQRRPEMLALIRMALGLVVGGAGFYWIAENPLHGCCALLLAGFLVMTGLEKHLARKAADTSVDRS